MQSIKQSLSYRDDRFYEGDCSVKRASFSRRKKPAISGIQECRWGKKVFLETSHKHQRQRDDKERGDNSDGRADKLQSRGLEIFYILKK